MYDRITIAIDGSDEAKYAAKRGLELALTLNATVDALYVVPQKSLQLTQTTEEQTRLRDRGEAFLSEIEELASEIDYPIVTALSEGKPAVQISKHASDQNTNLIIIGRQGITGLGKRFLGGVSEQVLYQSDVPVFVIPDTDQITEYCRILIPTDGSGNAEVAAPFGATIAQFYDSEIHVLNVVDIQAAGGVFNAGGLEKEFIERLEARGQKAVKRTVTGIDDTTPNANVQTNIKRMTSFEGVAAGIREYAEGNDIDLIVMGSHGRSNLRRQLLGNVASTILRTVDVPVLIVKRT
ncbi:universal stress protein [Halococcus hamelinensis]|nr:universal stress protein [Halococcus hamelinensis]